MEMVLGVSHDIHLDKHNWENKKFKKHKRESESQAEKRKKEFVSLEHNLILEINSRTPFSDCYHVLPMTINSPNPLPEFISQGTLRISDARGRAVKGVPKLIILDNNKLKQKFILPGMVGVDKLYGHFTYKCAGVTIKYKKELLVNRDTNKLKREANVRKLWISGTLKKDFFGWSLDLILPNKIIYNGSFLGHKPVICDAQGKPFKDYILRWGSTQANFPLVLPLTEGNQVKLLVSAGGKSEGLVHEARVSDPLRMTLKKVPFSVRKGKLVQGIKQESKPDLKYMSDFDPDTGAFIACESKHKVVLEFSHPKTSIKNMYTLIGTGFLKRKSTATMKFKIEYYGKGKWHQFSWGKLLGIQSFYPSGSFPVARKFRFTFSSTEPYKVEIRELHFIK